MANNYIPGFTPSLYGMPVKRMAIGGRMEGNRAFRERDDTIDYEAVGNPLGNLQNTLSNIDANAVLANYNNTAAPQMPTEMPQMPETPTEPVRKQVISDYNPYNIGNYGAQSYAEPSYQSQPTAQPVQTAPYYGDYSYDPYGIGNLDLSSYQLPQMPTPQAPTPQTPNINEPYPYYVDPGEFDPVYGPNTLGNLSLQYQLPQLLTATPQAIQPPLYKDEGGTPETPGAWVKAGPTLTQDEWLAKTYIDPITGTRAFRSDADWSTAASQPTEPLKIQASSPPPPQSQPATQSGTQMGALPTTQPGATSAAISANAPPPGTTWGVYSNPNDPTSQYTVNFSGGKKGAMPLTVSSDTPVFLYDNKTKQVLASGIGKEGADAVAAAVYKMNTDPNSKNEWWDIYTGPAGATDPSQFTPVVTDPRNKNFGQRFLGAVGTLLPLAVSFIPGLGQASLLTKIGAGAATGAASSALKGQDILKGGLLGGATAGLVNAPILGGGQSISGALSKAIGLGGNAANIGDLQARAIDTADFLTGLGVNPGLANQIASGSLSNIGSVGGGAIGSAIGGSNAGNNLIQVIGSKGASKIPSSFLSGALNTAGTALSGTNFGEQVWDRPAAQEGEVREPGSSEFNPDEGIVVRSTKYKVPFDPTSAINKALNLDFSGTPDYTGYEDLINKYRDMYDIEYPYDDEGWTVEGAKKLPRVIPPTAALPDLFDPLNSVDIPSDLVKEWPEIQPETKDGEIVVTGTKPGTFIPPTVVPGGTPPTKTTDTKTDDKKKKDDDKKDDDKKDDDKKDDKKIIDDILKVISTVGPIIGTVATTSSTPKSSFSAARGPLNPIFSAKLPKPNMQMAMPRALNFDAYRYGYGPEQSFFTNVPQGALNTSTAYTGYGTSPRYNATEQYASDFAALVEKMKKQREQDELEAAAAALGLTGYAEGGYAVGGAGDGREDKIPAMLSDGEYVMDAETVALLGNGSPKAGADMLDKFRVNVRKHKGRDLAKGKFSANAKKPEQYLKGRK